MSPRFTLDILDTITDPGKPGRPNEDRFGFNDCAAFVLDGATGLGDRQFMEGHGSDAAWIAEFAATRLSERLDGSIDPAAVLRQISSDARSAFLTAAGDQPRYAWPLCSLTALRATDAGFQYFGLGDSCLYVLHDDGTSDFLIPIPGAYEWEQQQAARHIARLGSIGLIRGDQTDPVTLEELRKGRALQNTPDGITWTFGIVPEAADHLFRCDVPLRGGGAHAILCSDGLADLVALYKAYDAPGLVRQAMDKGLPSLVEELRRLERETDPEGLTFPRFKQSDDTTAILIRLTDQAASSASSAAVVGT
ncbi:MAG: protein phosphatase 2C domain-containing protein [Alphaproteobacteria bacterium]|nr:protein phosphatase 2C domain-containing protein [Alphaproteobacteria bacterium]MBU1550498.1 protein phosphatase 2C domain-containing protein [Alphaproteobacteria bacterium]MBU2338634.1 protein phosphatase 2C domain-containing protein [Alphaproteobacteria bacterium]MBU2386725.1 protein phosphatase 2C domain-containing protein [Alphaproteobacteria bacterium]